MNERDLFKNLMIVSQMVAHTTIHDDSEFHAEVFVVFKLLLFLRREGEECACLLINDARAYLVQRRDPLHRQDLPVPDTTNKVKHTSHI